MRQHLRDLVILLAVFGGIPFQVTTDSPAEAAPTPSLRLNGVQYPDGTNALGGVFNVRAPEFNPTGACHFDGTTDDTACIQAAITAAGSKGPVTFPPGKYKYTSTLVLGEGSKLWGVGRSENAVSATEGSILVRGANVVGVQAVGVSTLSGGPHLSDIEIKNLSFDGGGYSSDLVQLKYVSNASISRNFFTNSAGRHIFLGEVYDSRITDNGIEWGGTSDGSLPMVELTSNGVTTYECTNQIHFLSNRFESFRGTALKISGACTNRLYFVADKFESQGLSNQPALDFTGVQDMDLGGIDVVESGTAANTIPELINLTNVIAFRGRVWLTHQSGGAGLTQYVNMTSCTKGDLDVQIDDTNYTAITNSTIVKQTTCDFVSIRGFPMDAGGVWAKDMTDQPATLPSLLQQYGTSPYLKQVDRTLNGGIYLGRIANNGGGGTLWKIIGLGNDNSTEHLALQIDANTGQVTFPVNAVSSNSMYVAPGAAFDVSSAGVLDIGPSATSVVLPSAGITITSSTFSSLGAPSNGTIKYCSDCTVAATCAGSGTGALAKRINGTWVCN